MLAVELEWRRYGDPSLSVQAEDFDEQCLYGGVDQPAVSQSEGLGRTNNHNQHNKGL